MGKVNRLPTAAAAVALLAGVSWIYAGVGGFDFVVFDDDINLLLNPNIGSLDAGKVAWAWTDMAFMRRYLPLGWLGFLGLFQCVGLEPAAYHWMNVVLHGLNAWLVFASTRLAMRQWCVRAGGAGTAAGGAEGAGALAAAFAAAAWWAWHPLRVELVAWVSGLLYLQASAWALLAWWAWLKAGEAEGGDGSGGGNRGGCGGLVECEVARSPAVGTRWRLVAALFFAASLLSYPAALAFPVVVLAWEWLLGRRAPRVLASRLWPLGLLSFACLAVTLLARARAAGIWAAGTPAADTLAPERLLAQVYSLFSYMARPLAPLGLSPVYDSLYAPTLGSLRLWAGVLALAACGAGALWAGRRIPAVPVVLGVVLLSLVPHLGWFEAVAYPSDRYLYLIGAWITPVFAVALGACLGVVRRRAGWPASVALCTAVIVSLGCAGWLAQGQTQVWRDSESLYSRIVGTVRHPEVRAFYLARFATVQTMLGRFEASDRLAAEARAAAPGFAAMEAELARSVPMRENAVPGLSPMARTHHSLAVGHGKAGDAWAMEAHLRRALRLSPRAERTAYDLAMLLAVTGRRLEARALFATIPAASVTAEERSRFEAACPDR